MICLVVVTHHLYDTIKPIPMPATICVIWSIVSDFDQLIRPPKAPRK